MYLVLNSTNAFVYQQLRSTSFAYKPFAHQPGTTWHFSNDFFKVLQRSQLPTTSICSGNTESCLNSPFFRFFVLPHPRDGNPGYVDPWMYCNTSQMNPGPEPLLLLGWLFHILMQVQESSLNGNSSA